MLNYLNVYLSFHLKLIFVFVDLLDNQLLIVLMLMMNRLHQ
jgi:hypothetical protein